jgi:hypothetical protein
LFRQDDSRAWDGVLFDVGEALEQFVASASQLTD